MVREVCESYELAPIQAGMLVHALNHPGNGVDIEQIVARLPGLLDIEGLVAAWRHVVSRHPILRSSLRWEDCPIPMQDVWNDVELPIARLDWTDRPASEQDRSLEAFLAEDRLQGIDLAHPPLMRLTFIALGAADTLLVWTFHHCLLDGRSFPLVLREVFAFSEDGKAAATSLAAPRPFRDHIAWLRERDFSASEKFWKARLAGFNAPVRLWLERTDAGPAAGEAPFGAVEQQLSPDATAAIQRGAARSCVTMNTLLQGAWSLLLARLSGESDIVFGATRACRRSGVPGADAMIGIFINTLPVRVDADPDAELTAWLQAIRDQSIGVREHEHTPLAKVQAWSAVAPGRPLFETIVVYEHLTLDAQLRALGGAWAHRSFQYIGQTNFPLALIAYGGERLLLRLEYAHARFDDATARRLLGYLETLLHELVQAVLEPGANPARLADLKLVPPHERDALIASGKAALDAPAAVSTLHGLFEQQVRRTPDAIVVSCGAASLSYAALNAGANRLAHALRMRGIGRGDLVGLAVERSLDIAVGILAILKAGGAYLPLDPDYPRDRLAFMVEDANVRVVLGGAGVEAPGAAQFLDIATAGEGQPDGDPAPLATTDDLAYVIYTSGSTGKPKGALVTHANVSRLFTATDHWFGFGPRDVWTLFHSYAFDFSVWELWGALLYGGRVVVVPYWVSRDPAAFRQLLVDERVTVLNQTPSAFRQLIQADLMETPADYALRYVVFGGEALELHSLKSWFERYSDNRPQLINMYGITETTVHVTYRPITLGDVEAGRGSVIGEPIPDLYIRLLDQRGEPVPAGVPGEIWVGGAGVANGYLNRAELTAQRFVVDPFDPAGRARLYRAGDLARRLPDGDLEFHGRIDAQVKIRGFRIELGEIEAALAACSGVADAAVIAREDTPGDKRLVAYLVVKDGGNLESDDLRRELSKALPEHMVPAHFVTLAAFPLNANGKLDRKALPAPSAEMLATSTNRRAFVEPRTETERTIAQVWAEVLRLERVGTADHFFELGGDSILSIQVVSRCRRAGITGFTTRDLFEHPTIAELARHVAPPAATVQADEVDIAGPVSLTPIQQWFFEQQLAEPNYWNQAFLFVVPAGLDIGKLEQALAAVIERHDAFRLRYRNHNRHLSAEDASMFEPVAVSRHDVSAAPEGSRAGLIASLCTELQGQLDIEDGRLVRAAHFELGAAAPGRLLIAIHHLAVDGVSWRTLIEDIEAAYECLSAGRPIVLPPRTTTYRRWAARLAEHAKGISVSDALPAWQAIVAPPAARLPMTSPDSLERDADTICVELTTDETAALLRDVPSAYRTQINDALLAALGVAMRQVTAGNSFLIDMEGHGREEIGGDLDVSRTVGWFTTLFPVRLDLTGASGIVAALKAVKEQLRRIPDRGLSYGLLRYLSADPAGRTSLASAPRAQILFNYLGQFDQVTAGSKLFAFAPESTGPWHGPAGRRTHPVEVLAQVRDGKLRIEWFSSATQIARAEIEGLAQGFLVALREIIAHCREADAGGRTPSDVPLAGLEQSEIDRLWQRYPSFENAYPLTPMQRLFHVMEEMRNAVGLEQWQFRIDGRLEPRLLRAAFETTIARHPILRSAFVTPPRGEPVQVVVPTAELPWHEHDLRALVPEAREAALQRKLAEDAKAGLDIAQPPLMRATLLRLTDSDWRLVWTTHHLCIDGWSWPRLFKEIGEIYAALEESRTPQLETAPPYSRYVGWLARKSSQSLPYWKEALTGLSGPTPFALALAGGKATSHQAEALLTVPAEITQNLQALARSTRLTQSTIVQAAWALVLAHYSGTSDVVLGASFSGRPAELDGVETLIGPCVTNVPVRVTFDAAERLRDWLARLQRQQLDLDQHQYAPLDAIQAASGIPWHSRLFDSLVVFQNYQVDDAVGRLGRNARLVPIHAPEATSYALTIAVTPGDELRARLIYDPSRLSRETIDAIVSDLAGVLKALAGSTPDATVVGILDGLPAERRAKAAAVAAASRNVPRRSTPAVPPKSDDERRLVALWSGLLGRAEVGIDDNFFDAGGQSMLLLRMHQMIEKEFSRKLPIVTLLQHPTIRTLAAHLGGAVGTPGATRPADAAAERARKQREALARQRTKVRPG